MIDGSSRSFNIIITPIIPEISQRKAHVWQLLRYSWGKKAPKHLRLSLKTVFDPISIDEVVREERQRRLGQTLSIIGRSNPRDPVMGALVSRKDFIRRYHKGDSTANDEGYTLTFSR